MKSDIHYFHNKPSADIKAGLKELRDVVKNSYDENEQDESKKTNMVLFIYYSGHGAMERGDT